MARLVDNPFRSWTLSTEDDLKPRVSPSIVCKRLRSEPGLWPALLLKAATGSTESARPLPLQGWFDVPLCVLVLPNGGATVLATRADAVQAISAAQTTLIRDRGLEPSTTGTMVSALLHATARSNARIMRVIHDVTSSTRTPALVIRISIRAMHTLSGNASTIWFQESHANVLYAHVGRVILGEPHAVEVVKAVRQAITNALPFEVQVVGTCCTALADIPCSRLPLCTLGSAIMGLALAANIRPVDPDAHVHVVCTWVIENMHSLLQMLRRACAAHSE